MPRKIQLLGLAWLSLSALCALTATSAFAVLTFELALWLINGNDVTRPVLVDAVGELTLLDLLNGAGVLCSGLSEGFVEPESLGLLTMMYDLLSPQNLIEELVGLANECTSDAICDASSALLWPIGLPWLMEVEQDNPDDTFWRLTLGAAWHFECTVFGIKAEELCEIPEVENEILNVTGGVEAVEETGKAEAVCNGTTAEAEIIHAAGNFTSAENGTLTVSLP
jgi:hypothetical protein